MTLFHGKFLGPSLRMQARCYKSPIILAIAYNAVWWQSFGLHVLTFIAEHLNLSKIKHEVSSCQEPLKIVLWEGKKA